MQKQSRSPKPTAVGIGTWRMGEVSNRANAEVAAIRAALDAGITLIDTAEMYGEGGAERIVGEAIRGRRDNCYLVSKVLPSNASRRGTIDACQRSLERLRTDRIDCYLLHWAGRHPLAETIEAFEHLKQAGLIGSWGVSNFDLDQMQRLMAEPGGERCAVNQVYYSLSERGIDYELHPWLEARGIVTMAYCPLDQGELVRDPRLVPIAERLDVTPGQLALAWLVSHPDCWAVPMTTSVSRAAENAAVRELRLDDGTRQQLERLFPPPKYRTVLKIV